MKIYKDLFNKLVSTENLLEAWDNFKKGKRKKSDVQAFEFYLEDNLFRLHRDLIHKRYKHSDYAGFYIRDPKIRHIHKAGVRDRVTHQATFQCLNPIFESTFINDSYSCRKEKGPHRGVKRLYKLTNRVREIYGDCFILKCDIKKFFPTIDHQILFNIIAKKIKDKNVLWLMQEIIESFSSEFSQENKRKGAPIGNLTSQFFANICLNELDQFIKQKLKIRYYIRYTDDFVIIHYNKDYLYLIKQRVRDFLKKELNLELHPNKIQIRKYRQGVDFLGYVSLPNARVVRTKTKRRIFKRLRKQVRQFKFGKITEETLMQSFSSYFGVLSHGNNYNLKQELKHKMWEWLREPSNN